MKRRLIRARIKLNQTIQQILEINRSRKKLPYYRNATDLKSNMDERLKVLNKIAEQQAKLIKHYEAKLEEHTSPTESSKPSGL
ncbi:MAG: hypothetical protein AAF705_08110 [Bacteroidota bacterium]